MSASAIKTGMKLTAFSQKQAATPTVDTKIPPMAGPTTRAALNSEEFKATAFWTSAGPTNSNTNACRVGMSIA